MSRRRTVVAFRIVTAPSFAACRCGATLAGLRAWVWRERDGTRGYGCRVCLFPASAIGRAEAGHG